MGTFANVVVEDQDSVRIVTVSRPRALNSLDRNTLVELKQLIGRAAAVILRLGAPDIRVVQLALQPAGGACPAPACRREWPAAEPRAGWGRG